MVGSRIRDKQAKFVNSLYTKIGRIRIRDKTSRIRNTAVKDYCTYFIILQEKLKLTSTSSFPEIEDSDGEDSLLEDDVLNDQVSACTF
jgi:hypothetical protein